MKLNLKRKPANFSNHEMEIIRLVEAIAVNFACFGKALPLNNDQLYYRAVADNLIENSEESRTAFHKLVKQALYAGLIDWHHLADNSSVIAPQIHSSLFRELQLQSIKNESTENLPDWGNRGNGVYVEVWVQNPAVFEYANSVCKSWGVNCVPCESGIPNKHMIDAVARFSRGFVLASRGVILLLTDYDFHKPETASKSIVRIFKTVENFDTPIAMPEINILGLTVDHVNDLDIPHKPLSSGKRGLSQLEEERNVLELPAVHPNRLAGWLSRKLRELDKG